jgi:hypothetical protein
MDGEWEAPKIKNPDFKGEWKAKVVIALFNIETLTDFPTDYSQSRLQGSVEGT